MVEEVLVELRARLDRLESESAIRAVIADYMRLCDQLDKAAMSELEALFTRDAVWAGRGTHYAATFGAHEGREAILAMLDSYRRPQPHFGLNVHVLGSEKILVFGETASATWVMLQASSYSAGGSDLKGARLHLRFAREDGAWRISRFETENLFRRAIDRWDDAAPTPVPQIPGG